ncbi:hypothetical protein [Halomonas alkalisoli]|uniref:hypothetical protein n=1 Tax=Halomonas alkalisoli TaxID=2907158 RepID=UPI001F2B251A|nr:hypothetical protein [Halomonas alkalisoli]MCE9683147.1 hypothetical protein [Halomonas alkalisoli]
MISKKKQELLKKIANKTLLPLGLELHRRKGYLRVRPDKQNQATAGYIVEFLGPSAIGKNTIFNKCKNKLNHAWNYDYDSEKFRSVTLDEILGSAYKNILCLRLDKVRESSRPILSETEAIINIVKRIQGDISMRGVNYTRGFFLREGLFAYFSSAINDLNKEQLKNLMSNRSFIIILPEKTETAVLRFIERMHTTGKQRNYFSHMSRDELYEAQDRAINTHRKFGLVVESLGCPVLWLKAEDDVESNAKRVIDFESTTVIAESVQRTQSQKLFNL